MEIADCVAEIELNVRFCVTQVALAYGMVFVYCLGSITHAQ